MENITVENKNTEIVGQESQEGTEQTVTYTEEQVLEKLQRETDRRVTEALKKQQAKFEQKMAEAEKLKQMDENQRKEYEFESRIKEFEAREKEFVIAQNRLEASKVMANRGLPVSFVDYIITDNADTMLENIQTFEKEFKAAVNDAVSKRIASPTPKAAGATQTGMTKDTFRKMTISQKSELFRTNPDLYKELSSN